MDALECSVSVIVCTHNRSSALRQALDSFAALEVQPGLVWELIVVANACTDDTQDVIAEFAGRLPIKLVITETPGVGNARNLGLRKARGQILAWTDDDCIADPTWLNRLWSRFAGEPTLAGLGGRVELYNPADLRLTIQRSRIGRYIGERGRFSREDLFFITGCNMAFTRRTFELVGEFDPRLGVGTTSGSAEDIDFLFRALRKGLPVAYDPDVVIYHNHGRRTDADAEALRRHYSIGRGAFFCKHCLALDAGAIRLPLQELRATAQIILSVTKVEVVWWWHITVGAWYRMTGR